MTVEELTDAIQGLDPETEVRFASQPSWPLEYSIESVVLINVVDKNGHRNKFVEKDIVYLEEGRQLGYLPGNVSEEFGWR